MHSTKSRYTIVMWMKHVLKMECIINEFFFKSLYSGAHTAIVLYMVECINEMKK